jgi:predicted anti-sigma-YlaC factor YlaD
MYLRGDIRIMNCTEAKALFSEFYDGELNQEIAQAVKEHLADCQECKKEYKDLKKSLKLLKKLKILEAPRNYVSFNKER